MWRGVRDAGVRVLALVRLLMTGREGTERLALGGKGGRAGPRPPRGCIGAGRGSRGPWAVETDIRGRPQQDSGRGASPW